MSHDVAFEEPLIVELSNQPVRTVEQAATIVRGHLQSQFTMHRLSTLLILERAAEGLEIEQAREAFRVWATVEFVAAPRA
jgi:hypothetical protein